VLSISLPLKALTLIPLHPELHQPADRMPLRRGVSS